MCLQCVVNPYYFSQVLPGFTLIRARREAPDEMLLGDWGLVEVNDPSTVWTGTPVKPAYWADTAEERERLFEESDGAGFDAEFAPPEDFINAIDELPIMSSYKLVKAAFEIGYVPEKDGHNFTWWLWLYLGNWINTHEPVVEDDPFPHLNATSPHDFNLAYR